MLLTGVSDITADESPADEEGMAVLSPIGELASIALLQLRLLCLLVAARLQIGHLLTSCRWVPFHYSGAEARVVRIRCYLFVSFISYQLDLTSAIV